MPGAGNKEVIMKKIILILITFSLKIYAAEYVVAVHEKNPITKITKQEITQILLVNKTDWSAGKPINLINYQYDSDSADSLFKNFAGMTALQAKKLYLTKVFNGVLQKQPATLETSEEIMDAVSENVNSIGLIEKSNKTSKAKILTIE